MSRKERESQKRIEAALKDPFYVVYLSQNELIRYIQIKNAIEDAAALG